MGLVAHYRGVAIWKRKAAKRPKWAQGFTPASLDSKRAYEIAAKNEKKFAQAYLAAVASMLDEKRSREFSRAWNSGSIQAVMQSLPFFADDPTGDMSVWDDFVRRMRGAYFDVARQTTDAVAESLGKGFGRKVVFEYVEKQAEGERLFVRTVPINPNALNWIDQRALSLVKEGMSTQQRKVVRSIIEDSFERGLHSVDAWNQIKDNIGLTSREYNAITNRRIKMADAGFQDDDIAYEASRYREELLGVRARRIARTETIFAESKGRQETWKAAEEAGALPKVQRVWISQPPGPSPDMPCEICIGLDGSTAPLTGEYDSDELGPIQGPPAHPNCTCTETIVPVQE